MGVRALFVVALVIGVTVIVYLEKGLVDSHEPGRVSFLNCLYYSLVTITTVGYGDIVPVGTVSRLTDAIVLTPVRFVVIFTIIGTAYQVALRRFQEEYRMNTAVKKLEGHTIVCGCGATGHAAVSELLLQGTSPDQVVVLDTNGDALDQAAELGVVCVTGDATREHVLESVAIERAGHVLVCPGRDDTAVLITLTVRELNPRARVIAMCHEGENVRQLERAGAHHIVHPAYAGGNLMAAATRRSHLVDTMEDLLSVGGTIRLAERRVHLSEVGRSPRELPDCIAIRVYRNDRHYDVTELPALEDGDVLVYVEPAEQQDREK